MSSITRCLHPIIRQLPRINSTHSKRRIPNMIPFPGNFIYRMSFHGSTKTEVERIRWSGCIGMTFWVYDIVFSVTLDGLKVPSDLYKWFRGRVAVGSYLVHRSRCAENDMLKVGEGNFHKFQKVPVKALQALGIFPRDPPTMSAPFLRNKEEAFTSPYWIQHAWAVDPSSTM